MAVKGKQEGLLVYHLEAPAKPAVPKPAVLPDHWQLCLPSSGWGRVEAENISGTLYYGQLLVVPPKQGVQLEFEKGGQWYQLFVAEPLFQEAACQVGLELPPKPQLIRLGQARQIGLRKLLDLLTQEEANQEDGLELARARLLELILLEVRRAWLPSRSQKGSEELIAQVQDCLDTFYWDDLTLEGLAKTFYVNKYYLSHLFTKKTGCSLYQYLREKRLEEARLLLAQGVDPGEASSRCGFKDYTNFYRAFKQKYKMSPRDYARGKTSP